MVRFLSEWSGRKTGSQPIAKEKEVRKKLTVARTGQRLWEITYGATSPRPSLPPRPLFLRVEARNCRTRAALAVFTLECEEWLLLAKRAPFNAGWIWEVSTNMCSITTVVLQMRTLCYPSVGWPELWQGPGIGRGIVPYLSERGGCEANRKEISLVPYIHGRHKDTYSSWNGDP